METITTVQSGWTIETLYIHFSKLLEEKEKAAIALAYDTEKRLTERLDEREKRYVERAGASSNAVKTAFESSAKAIEKSETAQREYNNRSNEFRAALDDQQKQFMPRTEINAGFKSVEDKIVSLNKNNDERMQEITKKLDSHSNRLTTIEGKGNGANMLWGYIIALIGVAAIIINLIRK